MVIRWHKGKKIIKRCTYKIHIDDDMFTFIDWHLIFHRKFLFKNVPPDFVLGNSLTEKSRKIRCVRNSERRCSTHRESQNEQSVVAEAAAVAAEAEATAGAAAAAAYQTKYTNSRPNNIILFTIINACTWQSLYFVLVLYRNDAPFALCCCCCCRLTLPLHTMVRLFACLLAATTAAATAATAVAKRRQAVSQYAAAGRLAGWLAGLPPHHRCRLFGCW